MPLYLVTHLHNVIPGNKVLAHLVDDFTLKGVARKLHEHGLESSTSTCMNANVPLVMCVIMCVWSPAASKTHHYSIFPNPYYMEMDFSDHFPSQPFNFYRILVN